MKPQGKVTIFMIVMIVMLSIYYFALPDNKQPEEQTPPPQQQPVSEFAELRELRQEARETMIQQLYANIVSAEVSIDDKNAAMDTIRVLNELTLSEGQLESQLTNIGFNDAFVKASTNKVDIAILSESLSFEEVNEIILMAKAKFGTSSTVVVELVPYSTN